MPIQKPHSFSSDGVSDTESTGATGYIGGTVLSSLVECHPEYQITVLLRNVPENFSERYPNVKVVKGDFDDENLISETAAQNDIVIREQDLGTSGFETYTD